MNITVHDFSRCGRCHFGQTLVVEMNEDTRCCGEYADNRTLLIVHRGLDKYR